MELIVLSDLGARALCLFASAVFLLTGVMMLAFPRTMIAWDQKKRLYKFDPQTLANVTLTRLFGAVLIFIGTVFTAVAFRLA
jgi:hypothetical protein